MRVLVICSRTGDRVPTYVQKDIDILASVHEVKVVIFERARRSLYPILKGIIWADVTYSWFCGLHAFITVILSRLLNRKSMVVAGGFDVVSVPELNYGQVHHLFGKLRTIVSVRLADVVLAVSESIRIDTIHNVLCSPKKVKTVYHGFEANVISVNQKDSKLVLTVSFLSFLQMKRKGIFTFVESARYLPDFNFILVGESFDGSAEYIKRIAPSNVRLTGYLSGKDLEDLYRRAKVYVQVSAHEGFGCSLAEAMLYQCVPVVTNKGAIPEVVGDTGFYVPYDNPQCTAMAIKEASQSDLGKRAQARILSNFSLEKRAKSILSCVENLRKVS